MTEQVTLAGLELPAASQISIKIEISAKLNISAFVAKQRANSFLIMEAGDQLCAGGPQLVVGPALSWRVPVHYTPSRKEFLGIVRHLLVNAETGEIAIADGQTSEDLLTRAEDLYERATL